MDYDKRRERRDNIDMLTHALINMGATLVNCGTYQRYELKAKYGAPELEPGRSAYQVLILPDDAIDTETK